MTESKGKDFRGEAVRRINQCIQRLDTQLYSSEQLEWRVYASKTNVEVTVTVGDRKPEKVLLDILFVVVNELSSVRNVLEALYARFIQQQPDLSERKKAAEIYAKIAKICGARSDVVQRLYIYKAHANDDTFIVILHSYLNRGIQQSFSIQLLSDSNADTIIKRELSIMIKALEDMNCGKSAATTQET